MQQFLSSVSDSKHMKIMLWLIRKAYFWWNPFLKCPLLWCMQHHSNYLSLFCANMNRRRRVIKSDSMIDVQGGMAGVVREGSNPLQFALTLLSSYQTHSLSLQDLQNLKWQTLSESSNKKLSAVRLQNTKFWVLSENYLHSFCRSEDLLKLMIWEDESGASLRVSMGTQGVQFLWGSQLFKLLPLNTSTGL